jgi:hypothetical protein
MGQGGREISVQPGRLGERSAEHPIARPRRHRRELLERATALGGSEPTLSDQDRLLRSLESLDHPAAEVRRPREPEQQIDALTSGQPGPEPQRALQL